MRRRNLIASGIAAATAAALAAAAFGLGGTYSKDHKVVEQPGWPKGLADLANSPGRVNGYFINANDFFFYAGDAKACGEFLDRYAAFKDMPLVLILHPGRGLTGGLGDPNPAIPFDWGLSIVRRGWGADMPEAYRNSPSQVVVTVNLYVGGRVSLNALEVPLTVEVRSGGEIERFVAHHEAKRTLLAPPADRQ